MAYVPPDLGDGWNLDGMDPNDLTALARALEKLAHYAETKSLAMRHRASGHMVRTEKLEYECQLIYGTLPPNWRW